MPIEFVCPNGHKLKSPDERAGKTDRCPKCGASVEIPAAASASNSKLASSSGTGKPLPAGHIEFRCPSGHKLNGPASLQGKLGKCPHCGARFHIPVIDHDAPGAGGDVADEWTDDLDLPPLDTMPAAAAEDEPLEEPIEDIVEPHDDYNEFAAHEESETDEIGDEYADEEETWDETAGGVSHAAPAEPPLRRLFERLWEEKQHGAIVRIHLEGGDTFEPQFFSPRWSRSSHGVFAAKGPDGKYIVTTIAWGAMQRIEVTPLEGLPDESFE